MLRTSVDSTSRVLAVCGAICTTVLMVAVALDVLGRSLLGESVPGVVEFSESLMVGIVFLGMAEGERVGSHVRVELFTQSRSAAVAGYMRVVGLLALAGIVAWMLRATAPRAWMAFVSGEYRIGLLRFPQWPARFVLVVGLVAMLVQVVVKTIDAVRDVSQVSNEC